MTQLTRLWMRWNVNIYKYIQLYIQCMIADVLVMIDVCVCVGVCVCLISASLFALADLYVQGFDRQDVFSALRI